MILYNTFEELRHCYIRVSINKVLLCFFFQIKTEDMSTASESPARLGQFKNKGKDATVSVLSDTL